MKNDNFSKKWLKFFTLISYNLQMRPFADYSTMLEWREHENEGTKNAAMNDQAPMCALKNFGLYKF